MPKKLIITDDIDLSKKDEKLLLHDSVYPNSEGSRIILDSANSNAPVTLKDGVYAILSVSDKPINNRLYDYESLKLNVMNKDWLKPYKKPLLRNHDLYTDMPSGRIIKSWFVDHKNFEISKPDLQDDLPKKVFDFFKDSKCFDNGTGSVVVEVATDANTYERIKNELDVTVSQSSYMGKATCNICHQDYFGQNCNHFSGDSYEIEIDKETVSKTCYVECSDFDPIELSIVNNPANDSSIFYVYDKTEVEPNSDSNNSEEKKINDSKIDNSLNKDKIEETEKKEQTIKMEDSMLKDLLKNNISKFISDKFGEATNETFIKLFDSLDKEEQIANFQSFLDSLPEHVQLEDETVATEEPKTEDQVEATEEPKTEDEHVEEETTGNDDNAEEVKGEDEVKKDSKTPESKKSEDLKDIYGETKKVQKDTNLNRKISAILNNF